jgi:hypothetical protein
MPHIAEHMSSVVRARTESALSCLVFHAERLERDEVWGRTDALLRSLEDKGIHCTLFVHPYSAIRSGVDIGRRIQQILGRGHEIGQHTHYYSPPTGSGKPESDLSPQSVCTRLEQDREYLAHSGAEPRGFTAGAWVEHPAAATWLNEAGFTYDCTGRTFGLRSSAPNVDPKPRWSGPKVRDGLVGLPTTASVAQAVRELPGRRSPSVELDPRTRYELIYVHDYDLLRWSVRTGARAVVQSRTSSWCTAAELAATVGASL